MKKFFLNKTHGINNINKISLKKIIEIFSKKSKSNKVSIENFEKLTYENKNYYYIEEFEKYGITAVYTKKIAGNMSDYCPIENQIEGIQKKNREKLLKDLNLCDKQEVMAFQTHSNNVKTIDEDTTKYYYEKEEDIDGFLTKRKDIAIFTFYADCLPIFVYDKENQVIGVWHSGWPGTFKQIMKSGLLEMKKNY